MKSTSSLLESFRRIYYSTFFYTVGITALSCLMYQNLPSTFFVKYGFVVVKTAVQLYNHENVQIPILIVPEYLFETPTVRKKSDHMQVFEELTTDFLWRCRKNINSIV
jgi:hypothetical protein